MILFKEFILEENTLEELSEEELDQLADSLSWEDIEDLYSPDEFVMEEEIVEDISATSRMQRGQKFRSMKMKMLQARKMKLKRASSVDVLKKRSKLAARRVIMKRYLRGRNKSQISAQEKNRLESQIRNMPNVVGSLSNKLLPKMRKLEQKRLSNLRKPK
jgi:hypothetical protein